MSSAATSRSSPQAWFEPEEHWCPSSGRPRRGPPTAWRSTSLSSPIVPNWVRSSSGCGTDDCGRTSATSRPSTMPSPPSTRPSDARGRRSSAFVRERHAPIEAVAPCRASSKGDPHEIIAVLLSALAFAMAWPCSASGWTLTAETLKTTETDNVETAERPLVAPHLEAAAAHAGLLGRAGRKRDADHRRVLQGPQRQRPLMHAAGRRCPGRPAASYQPQPQRSIHGFHVKDQRHTP